MEITQRELITFTAQMVNSIVSRSSLMGEQTAFGGTRNYYKSLGYPETIEFSAYLLRYERQDIAGRIIDLPAIDAWKNHPVISEDGNEETAFAKAWADLTRKSGLRVWSALTRADRLSGIGEYGILLLGLRTEENYENEVKQDSLTGAEDLLFLRPFTEGQAEMKPEDLNDDKNSERYGQPNFYMVTMANDKEVKVHWSRVIHLADGKLDSELRGTPRLKRIFNRLDDIIKLVGGGSEASWLNMRRGSILRPMEGYDAESIEVSDIQAELDKYAHDPLRMLWLAGVESEAIGDNSVTDVTAPFDIAFSLISAATSIPKRVLEGSAAGELAAAQEDTRQWASVIAARQQNYVEPEILRPFIDRLIYLGILPSPKSEGYHIGTQDRDGEYKWPSIIETTESEEAEIADKRASAISRLSNANFIYPITPDEKREVLGFVATPETEIEEIEEGTPAAVIGMAINNFRQGKISGEQLAEFAIASWADAQEAI